MYLYSNFVKPLYFSDFVAKGCNLSDYTSCQPQKASRLIFSTTNYNLNQTIFIEMAQFIFTLQVVPLATS